MKRFALLTFLILSVFLYLPGMAAAQDREPDAYLELSEGSVAIGIGYSWGEGTLTYQDKKYPVEVKGLSVIDVGITKATAFGKVYNLKKLEDFNGNYTAATAEGTLGGGAGATTMKNQSGVVIDLYTTTKGLNLKLAPSGIALKLK
ncbi:MAG TPA: EipA family protein [Syntrophales bacterium]|nr:EipA family protein [Syntrophales bacterium]